MKRVLYYCQNLLGLGHLVRSSEIIRHLAGVFEVCLVFGGERVAGFELPAGVRVEYLPALRRERGELIVIGGGRSLGEVKTERERRLLAIYHEVAPDGVIIEGFPFSKRALAFELVPLLEAVCGAGRPVHVATSLRDVVLAGKGEGKRGRREGEIVGRMNRFVDTLYVHSDERVLRLDERFSRLGDIRSEVVYTGYVVAEDGGGGLSGVELAGPRPLVVVSVGGGRLGHDLLDGLVPALGILGERVPHVFRIFSGPLMPAGKYGELCRRTEGMPHVVVRRYTPHLGDYLRRAELSINLCGYNTAMEVMKSGVRSLAFPSDKDLEQRIRAERFEALGILSVLEAGELLPERLAERVCGALAQGRRGSGGGVFAADGARATAEHFRAAVARKLEGLAAPCFF